MLNKVACVTHLIVMFVTMFVFIIDTLAHSPDLVGQINMQQHFPEQQSVIFNI